VVKASKASVAPPPGTSNVARSSVATRLVELANAAGIELFHAEGEPYVRIPAEGHRETWSVRSTGMRLWLRRAYHQETGGTVHAQAVHDALATLEARAMFDGHEGSVFTRVAGADEKVYLDLADAGWRMVEIAPGSWRVREDTPVCFRRPRGMQPLPAPVSGGALDALRSFINVTDDDWPLVAVWMLAALLPAGPYPVLVLHGEQGAAKSTLTRVLRRLVDPHQVPLRSEPREVLDLMIAAKQSWVLAFDNVSALTPWLSDALCRLATGGGFGTRTFYTNDEETLFEATRPVILNGIEEIVTRPDLLDRSLLLALPVIPETQRRAECDFWPAFEAARPVIFGAVCDVLAGVLEGLPHVRQTALPRMADFTRVGLAVETVLRWPPGTFETAAAGNRAGAYALTLEESPVAGALVALLDDAPHWTGTATTLLAVLAQRLGGDDGRRPRGWPANAQALSGQLRRLASTLRATGVAVTFAKSGQRAITLEKVGNFSPTASLASNCGSPLAGTDAPLDAKDARSGAPSTRPGAGMVAPDVPDANPPLPSHEREPGEEG
jgi:hypothetical protein